MIYGALERMAARRLVEVEWEETVEGRLRRYYRITGGGRDAVVKEPTGWRRPHVTWRRNRTHPAHALATGLVLASVAYPLVWVAIRWEQVPTPYWAYNGAYQPLLLAALPLLLALVLMRRAGRRGQAAALDSHR